MFKKIIRLALTPIHPLGVFHPSSPRIIIYKSHKVVVTSNRYCIGRSPNISVNIIQNPLGAVSLCDEFHRGLLFDDAIFTKLQFAGFGTFQ